MGYVYAYVLTFYFFKLHIVERFLNSGNNKIPRLFGGISELFVLNEIVVLSYSNGVLLLGHARKVIKLDRTKGRCCLEAQPRYINAYD